jgi:hypothetical protein
MIITRLLGGLGNQMFQYAAGLALAERRRTVLKLDVSWFREDPEYEAHNRYGLGAFNVTEQFATAEEIDRVRGVRLSRAERALARVARALRLHQVARRYATAGHWHRAESFPYYPGFADQPDSTYLDGMWQSARFFAPAADRLRQHFTVRYPSPPAVRELAQRIRAGGPSAAVHFRRGDYARNPRFREEIGVLGLDYYERAVGRLRALHPDVTLYIFSDDIDAIEREFRPAGPHVFVRSVPDAWFFEKLPLMALCDHAIISNSTFAWWGAWLNPSPTRVVIAPDPWFAGGPLDGRDVVPESWIRLGRNG